MMPLTLPMLALLFLAAPATPTRDGQGTSGRRITPEEEAYDVQHYDLALKVDPQKETIEGVLTMRARVVAATPRIRMDLHPALDVERVVVGGETVKARRDEGALVIPSPRFESVGDEVLVAVSYGGKPRVAPRPPWDGGFTWEQTPSGAPWIATSCQAGGADLWWPCKDQPSDEADSFDLHVTVPRDLVVATNGRLVGVEDADRKGWRTHHWHVSTPINNYGIALNIAPYETISGEYESTAGDTFPVTYWVLPENVEKGRALFQEMLAHLRFFEETFGPYPFRADKFGVAETPHLGMEHQTIIAYGNHYRGNPWGAQRGFDFLLHHESAHEWWANLVTAKNWNDFWIHESLATYAQSLYVERLVGAEAYRAEIAAHRRTLANRAAVAPRDSRSTTEMYFGRSPDSPGGDIYFKGAVVLHTLRWLLGDETFFTVLRRWAYPDPALERATDGSACRFATTDELVEIAERVSGRELAWFFELYLRQPKLPRLVHALSGRELSLTWETPAGLPFPMPVPLVVDGETRRVEMPDGRATVALGRAQGWELDPLGWILVEAP